jgi:hypothetical protein
MAMLVAAVVASIVFVHGTVTIGPTQPVCKVGTPCSKPAAHALLEFTQQNRIRWAKTDAKGNYSVRLEPGTWTLHANQGVRAVPERFIVRNVRTQLRNFAIDSGIR